MVDQHSTDSRSDNDDLFEHVQWQLEWKINRTSFTIPTDNCNVVLILSCIPKPEFADDIWVTIGFTLYSGEPSDGNIIHDVSSSSVRPIKLTKKAHYQCILIRDTSMRQSFADPNVQNGSYPQFIQLNRFRTHLGAKIVIVHMGYPSSNTLRDDLGALLNFDSSTNQNKFCDVKFVLSPKESGSTAVEFPVHKVILAARSPVFAKMFEHDMLESASNKVKVDDIQPSVFKEMLTYIYTGWVPKIGDENMAYDLLYVADKYQLDHLKSLCEQQIISSLQVRNAARIIQLAHLHNAPELKRVTLRFISKNAMAVRATREWEQVKQSPEILDEIIQTMHTVILVKN